MKPRNCPVNKYVLSIILILLMAAGVSAQVDSVRLNRKYLESYWTDTRDMVTAPVRWKGRQWLGLAAFSGTTFALTALDEPVRDYMQKHQDPALARISRYGLEPFGNLYSFGTIAGFLVHGLWTGNDRSRSTALMAAESYVLSGLLVRISKILAGRSRPDAPWNPGPDEWEGPFNGKSFPSGHTTSAFAVASVIAWQYRETKWVPAAAWTVASAVAMSRMYDNKHWLSDAFAGAVIGAATGRFICRQHDNSRLLISPGFSAGNSGMKIVLRW